MVFNADTQKIDKHSITKNGVTTRFDEGSSISVRSTQMPNGKIYIVKSGYQRGNKICEVYEINKRKWIMEKRMVMYKNFFYEGAVTSTVNNKILISGS